MTNEEIAQVTHEANRVIQYLQGDPAPSPHWDDAGAWQRDSAIDGVRNALDGVTPEESHENWVRFKAQDGWVYGETKDEMARTHPCMVSYNGLPPEQKLKDHLFLAIVKALS